MSTAGPTVAVLGAGNVGCALAADLTLRGFAVRLCNRSGERLESIRRDGLALTGVLEGVARIPVVTDEIAEAVRGADVIAVTVPTSLLGSVAREIALAATHEQILWLNPGHSGGALFLAAEFRRLGRAAEIPICQLTTATHGARLGSSTAVQLFGRPRVSMASFPSTHLERCHELLDCLLPGQIQPIASVLEADLANMNAVLHPAGMVANAGWLESVDGHFPFYSRGIGPGVARIVDAVDAERIALAQALGVPATPLVDLLLSAGYTTAEGAARGRAHDALQAGEALRDVEAPPGLLHRYLHEDVGCGLVPWTMLAAVAGVPTPVMSALVVLAGALNGVDYAETGFTLERLGLAGMSASGIAVYATGGRFSPG